MDCGAMARNGNGVGRQPDARSEVLQIRVSKARRSVGGVAESDGEHVAACPIMLFVARVAKGFRRIERRHLRRQDGDRLLGWGIASLMRGAASDGELPEPRNGYRLVPCERVGDGGEHGANRPLGGSPDRGGLGSDVRDEVGPVHDVLPSSCGWASGYARPC